MANGNLHRDIDMHAPTIVYNVGSIAFVPLADWPASYPQARNHRLNRNLISPTYVDDPLCPYIQYINRNPEDAKQNIRNHDVIKQLREKITKTYITDSAVETSLNWRFTIITSVDEFILSLVVQLIQHAKCTELSTTQ